MSLDRTPMDIPPLNASQTMNAAFFITWLSAGVRLAGPVLAAALGELVAERSGVLNVGIEGTMLLGALTSFLTSQWTDNILLSLSAGILCGVLANLFLAWMYITVRASQVVVGLVFNVLALGIASSVYWLFIGDSTAPRNIQMFQPLSVSLLSRIPFAGPILFNQAAPLYLTLIAAIFIHLALYRTRVGLALRAAGENPKAADAAGISVAGMRYLGMLVSGAMAGFAGAYLVLAQVGFFRETIVAGQGFIALGIVIFGRWSAWKAVAAAPVFGACDALQFSATHKSKCAATTATRAPIHGYHPCNLRAAGEICAPGGAHDPVCQGIGFGMQV